MWIVGGVVVAIGAIAYLSHNKAPAGKDAAGTIVEAKRARADGTNSFNPTPTASTTEQSAADVAKGTAVADAANAADAAAAAGNSGDNAKKTAHPDAMGTNGQKGGAHVAEAADAAAAAGRSGDNAKKMTGRFGGAAEAKAASDAMIHAGANARATGANASPSAIQQQANSESINKN